MADSIRVVDASAIGALLFGEPEGPVIVDRLRGARLVAPALLRFETANICLKKMRRHPEMRDELATAFASLSRMAIDEVEVDHRAILDVAAESGLTAYDASYLWLARRMGAELVTLDRRLAAAIG